MDDDIDWSKLDWGKAVELGLCLVAFLLGFAHVAVSISAIGLALGFGARHAERWPQRLAYLKEKRSIAVLAVSVTIAMAFDGLWSALLYALGYGVRWLIS